MFGSHQGQGVLSQENPQCETQGARGKLEGVQGGRDGWDRDWM